jgi:hypothetical protein
MRINLCGRLVLWYLLTIPVMVFALVFSPGGGWDEGKSKSAKIELQW